MPDFPPPLHPSPSGSIRGRFAPSPTGALHLGLARTALLAWLGTRKAGGSFLMRVEDLDTPRVVPGAAQAQLDDLRWLGLEWDEGPDVGGPLGPYVQSERQAHYTAALELLRAQGHLYPCTCSRREIALASAPHGPSEYGTPYPGTCRSGPSHPERAASLRFRVPESLPDFVDGVHGPISEHGATGDFVVQRADGLFSYQLAVVVDDLAMGVNQVVRGDDLLGCTGWQLALYAALGSLPPEHFHVPLVLGPDGTRLAKRHAGVSLADCRDRGASPARIVGALAGSLGLVAEGSTLSPQELLAEFAWDRVGTQSTRLDGTGLLGSFGD